MDEEAILASEEANISVSEVNIATEELSRSFAPLTEVDYAKVQQLLDLAKRRNMEGIISNAKLTGTQLTSEMLAGISDSLANIQIIEGSELPTSVLELIRKYPDLATELEKLIEPDSITLDIPDDVSTSTNNSINQSMAQGGNKVTIGKRFLTKLSSASESIKNWYNDNLRDNPNVTKLGVVKFISIAAIIGMLIGLVVMISKKQIDPVTAAVVYANHLSGCYMITGSSNGLTNVVKLDGCSDWYGTSLENQLRCGCSSTTSTTHSTDCTVDCGMPYCIGQTACTGTPIPGVKCTNPLNPALKLGKCAGNIGDSNFVYYTYQQVPPITFFNQVKVLQNIIQQSKNNTNSTGLQKALKIGGITLGVIVVLIGAIFLIKYIRNRNVK